MFLRNVHQGLVLVSVVGRRLFSSAAPIPPVRVRFAPSPTGQLHLGGFRTALYNYLYARSQGGTFILRIEDTDQARMVPGAAEKLEEMLGWLGIVADESPSRGGEFGPYRQSERLQLYQESVDALLAKGEAYRCFCTERRMELLRKEAARTRQPFGYDGRCRELSEREVHEKLSAGEPHTVRFRLKPSPEPFHDLVVGEHARDVFEAEGDPIIFKSDGFPTYHLANVVDDHHMRVSHVLRGVEWLGSTPKHLQLYEAFGWHPPQFAHLPLIMNPDGTKLSKRQGDIHIESYRDRGYFPEAVVNFATLAGGGFADREHRADVILSLEDFAKKFDLGRMVSHSCRIEFHRLDEANQAVLAQKLKSDQGRREAGEELRERLEKSFGKAKVENHKDEYLLARLEWAQHRIHKISDLAQDEFKYLWVAPDQLELAADLNLGVGVLNDVCELFENDTGQLTSKEAVKMLKEYAKANKIKFPILMKFLRIVITGGSEGPPIGELFEVLGRAATTERLKSGIKLLNK